ncbi:MAG: hypothetical protein HY537_11335 [Deltaproteobacteria bacterium]|nr:hypothetical protein [Deltaproteobacteria bacterium]
MASRVAMERKRKKQAFEMTVRRAQIMLEKGLEAVLKGKYKRARERFKQSVEFHRTADALTYWAWMEHALGNTAMAILLCHKAIDVDPDFGNPYNDIGSYLIAMGKWDEAIPWLEKAAAAPRYQPRQFPHMNLGKVYLAKSMPRKALHEFQKALTFSPDNQQLKRLVETVEKSFH